MLGQKFQGLLLSVVCGIPAGFSCQGSVAQCDVASDCDNDLFCDGQEFCQDQRCQPGTPPGCADAFACTQDSCDEASAACVHRQDDAQCLSDEVCDPSVGDPATGCRKKNMLVCRKDNDCDDGVPCNGKETCVSGSCQPGTPVSCDDGLFCNGQETCVSGSCQPGTPPACEDGIACTVDSCDENLDTCQHQSDDQACQSPKICKPEMGGCVDPDNPSGSRFGIGLISPGNTLQWDLAANLVGQRGYIKLIFVGIDQNLGQTPEEWKNAVTQCYNRQLIPVIRLGPDWGNRNVRNMGDNGSYVAYTALAQKYKMVVQDLPLREGWPLILEIHNEPNLCYEWTCNPGEAPANSNLPATLIGDNGQEIPCVSGSCIHYADIAREYASYLRDVVAALHSIGDARIQVLNAGFAPGGVVACQCGGNGWRGGMTGLDFMTEMKNAVPDIWNLLDGWASHPYPARGVGYDFFFSYQESMAGLLYFESELGQLGRDLPVFITETGWTIDAGARGSREDIAAWTVAAYQNPWLSHDKVKAVMPFQLQDSGWEGFAWADQNGNPYPVYNAVRNLRCSMGIPPTCSK